MRQRLFKLTFNLAAAVSLVLCVATAALWVRGYWRGDVWWLRMHASSIHGYSAQGVACIQVTPNTSFDPYRAAAVRIAGRPSGHYVSYPYPVPAFEAFPDSIWKRLGFLYSTQFSHAKWMVCIPYWALVFATVVLPVRLLVTRPGRTSATPFRPLPHLRLRPPRHARPLPGVRGCSGDK